MGDLFPNGKRMRYASYGMQPDDVVVGRHLKKYNALPLRTSAENDLPRLHYIY
jgi:hypothetical protein